MSKIKPLINSSNNQIYLFSDERVANVLSLNENAVAVYEMEETSGTSAADATGINSGTIQGNVTLNQSGKIGKCFLYNTGTYSRILSTYNSMTTSTGEFSFNCWVNRGSTSIYDIRGIYKVPILINGVSSAVGGWLSGNGSFYFSNPDDADNFTGVYGTLSASTWYMVTHTIGPVCKLYVNAELQASISWPGFKSYSANDTVYIGYVYDGAYRPFGGYLDQAAFWTRELNQTDINTLYNSGNGLAYINW